jgi:hypothetical protein
MKVLLPLEYYVTCGMALAFRNDADFISVCLREGSRESRQGVE